ncbi:MAG TPA: hypothetical protein VMS09_15390 [Paenibacillus sp.]|uniref:hypothetical protein n=1 Tax=Paenibacillus sp. TaxID=58172 RepID=UPI002D196EC4|nr:hypothetical protein [Paenibacillus sp.]HUC93380.1 hypothetical protein [Paenibacillus sp.]
MVPNLTGNGRKAGPLFHAFIWSLLPALLCGGCADPHRARSPEETLAIAAAGLSGIDRYDFRVRTGLGYGQAQPRMTEEYEGKVIGHSKRTVRRTARGNEGAGNAKGSGLRDPADRLSTVRKLAETVEYADPAEDGPNLTLRIRLRPDSAAEAEAASLRAEFERSAEAAGSETIRNAAGGAKADQTLRRAVREEIAASRHRLEAMLRSLEVDDVVELSVDGSRMLPVRMKETVVMRYEADGRQRTEKRVTSVTFAGFDGKPVAGRATEGKS